MTSASNTSISLIDTHNNSQQNLPKNRFELELEFIQSLASPRYLHHLANQNYLRDEKFLQFLQYLKYWKQPEYANYITYPHCFFFLDLLCDSETFRNELVNMEFQNFVHQQQFFNWQYRSRRLYGTGAAAAAAEGEASLMDNGQSSEKGI